VERASLLSDLVAPTGLCSSSGGNLDGLQVVRGFFALFELMLFHRKVVDLGRDAQVGLSHSSWGFSPERRVVLFGLRLEIESTGSGVTEGVCV